MKNNKKGFTLAELLIVVAIIAILIAIAIPVFSGQLDNAKIQTDHANMRSAYALAQTGSIQGGLYVGRSGTDKFTAFDESKSYVFMSDGSLEASDGTIDNAYKTKATVKDKNKDWDCKESAVCNMNSNVHAKDKKIVIKANTNKDGYTVVLD